jgi:hypothetical protein
MQKVEFSRSIEGALRLSLATLRTLRFRHLLSGLVHARCIWSVDLPASRHTAQQCDPSEPPSARDRVAPQPSVAGVRGGHLGVERYNL